MKAKELVYEMINKDSPHPNIVFFSSIINGLCKEGNVTYAQDIFNLVVEIGESPDVTTFTSLSQRDGRNLCRSCVDSVLTDEFEEDRSPEDPT